MYLPGLLWQLLRVMLCPATRTCCMKMEGTYLHKFTLSMFFVTPDELCAVKCTTSKSKHTAADFAQLKRSFPDQVVHVVTMEAIPAELILNREGIHILPSTSWTMDKRGLKQVELIGAYGKHQITTVFLFKYDWRFSSYPTHLHVQRED